MSTKNKSFSAALENNPAMRFITQPQELQPEKAEESKPIRETNPPELTEPQQRVTQRFIYGEKKSQRIQLVMQPSIVDRAKAAAESENISLNEYIHRAITEKLNREGN